MVALVGIMKVQVLDMVVKAIHIMEWKLGCTDFVIMKILEEKYNHCHVHLVP